MAAGRVAMPADASEQVFVLSIIINQRVDE